MPSDEGVKLVYDIIARMMEICRDDYDLLARCALVNWEFNQAASRMLYWHVVISPAFSPVLNLRDTGAISESSNFSSACLPRNARYVTTFEVSGHISPRPPPRNTLPEKISNALSIFVNLVSIRFTPKTYHDNLFQDSGIPALLNLKNLTELSVNTSCTDGAHAPKLVEIVGLRKLTLYSPGRTILELLPAWIERLCKSLVELHLRDNCGSITPGVLKSFVPHIEQSLQAFTLGLSYSLTDDDVFTFLGHIKNLKHLELMYYWARRIYPHKMLMPIDAPHPRLSSLRSFTVNYPHLRTRKEVNEFDKWVRRAITGSTDLHTLRLRCEDDYSHLSHDALIVHLVEKHSKTLKVLELTFVSIDKLTSLCAFFQGLEELSLQAGMNSIPTFIQFLPDYLPHLHTASFEIRNVPAAYRAPDALIINTMRKGAPSLRRLTVDGDLWEVRSPHRLRLLNSV
ncbi:hypothetical protein CPB84DRAFT_1677109 [Gymnopilus junonius]|uniref:F-box domain-containing protein n=1 Tax=Gymnopilus junonius TaxID=109634 RepID=A0A9P5TQ78_GYMJU|nr:hypothetical protein CPB84DRAFT_1677109 [Gymnopilus junonius]